MSDDSTIIEKPRGFSCLEGPVRASLAEIERQPEDQAAIDLAIAYAAAIDEAAALYELSKVIDPEDESQARQLAQLAAGVDAQKVLSDLGPKLLVALESLGATPRARKSGRETAGGRSSRPASALANLRKQRQP